MTAILKAPNDLWAEETVVGCAIATRSGADLASSRLEPDDFYSPQHGRLFAAALRLDVDSTEDRIAAVVEATGVDASQVCRLVEDRAVMRDTNGGFAARVADAARRRRLMSALSEAYNALGCGARLDEIRPTLRVIESALGVSA